MRTLILLAMLFGAQANATTDWNCMSQCQQAGIMYGLCQNRCEYKQPVQDYSDGSGGTAYQPIKQTDYNCQRNCESQGGSYVLCHDKCSY